MNTTHLIAALFVSACLPFAATAESIASEKHSFTVERVAQGLNHPWSLVFLPNGDMLVSERNGGLKRVTREGVVSEIQGLPEKLVYRGQGGLLGLTLSPDFKTSNRLFIAYAEEGEFRKSGTAVSSAILDGNTLKKITPIFSQSPKLAGGRHYGGRLLATDEHLYIALGDRGNRDKAQQNNSHIGTLVRLNLDGSLPSDNPFVGQSGSLPEIYSYGHRNIQGMTLDNDGKTLWTHEHGPQGGDELNPISKGNNYGWPTITYGVNYGTGSQIGTGTAQDGMEQPVHYWVPSIAPSGMEMISGKKFQQWQGDILLGSLKFGLLVRLDMDNGKVIGEERLLDGNYGRIRDVVESPDGNIYLLTDSSNGEVLKLSPL
ncbi:PQQ-dependent sugar dehydrogenase [Grimontia sp. S25]|uniref:PQQ-dependent sugar dehydrogenase n=1 Tax=Grimontia sedimenti TaxID=2711294 RepID=A0A6M1R7K0_9GAMM|nr:PQQ-dependent sugar dehydrogenase [Grimontia sedimenti]NGN96120.1 PQQ-dependent sugar dehydrogenase [Grimontia sedimenti]